MSVIYAVLFLFYVFIGYWLRNKIHLFLIDHSLVIENYKGKMIPIGYGLYLWLMAMIFGLMLSLKGMNEHYPILLGYSAVFILGWIDDTIGASEPKGLGGHVKVWLYERKWTTGLLKACGISTASFWVVLQLNSPWWALLFQVILIALSANFLNLLDVRPGRAIKGFWLFALLVSIVVYLPGSSGETQLWQYLMPFLVGTLFLLPLDLKAKGMLGDAGANLLGFAAGYAAVAAASYWLQLVLLLLLMSLHWYAERQSLTKAIEAVGWLKAVDRWGRI